MRGTIVKADGLQGGIDIGGLAEKVQKLLVWGTLLLEGILKILRIWSFCNMDTSF